MQVVQGFHCLATRANQSKVFSVLVSLVWMRMQGFTKMAFLQHASIMHLFASPLMATDPKSVYACSHHFHACVNLHPCLVRPS